MPDATLPHIQAPNKERNKMKERSLFIPTAQRSIEPISYTSSQ
jgi:hypothetical protein